MYAKILIRFVSQMVDFDVGGQKLCLRNAHTEDCLQTKLNLNDFIGIFGMLLKIHLYTWLMCSRINDRSA